MIMLIVDYAETSVQKAKYAQTDRVNQVPRQTHTVTVVIKLPYPLIQQTAEYVETSAPPVKYVNLGSV